MKTHNRRKTRNTAIELAGFVAHYSFLVLLMNIRETQVNFWTISGIVALGIVAICLWVYFFNKPYSNEDEWLERYIEKMSSEQKEHLLKIIEKEIFYDENQ